jgi:hypothetical protein
VCIGEDLDFDCRWDVSAGMVTLWFPCFSSKDALMKSQRKAVFALCAALMFAGCTRVVVKKDPGYDDKGFRYYRPKPYLFITPGTSGGGGGGASTFSIQQGKPLEIKTSRTGNAAEIVQTGYQLSDTDADVTDGDTFQALPAPGPPNAPQKISIDLVYMPDFAEEYSVELKPGLGIGELSMKLEDGWKLTSVGIKTDQQVDEIIGSVAELVEAGSGLVSPASRDAAAKGHQSTAIYATNVPFGFYEAVIACDPCGRKQLYGWRYVGFMPFQSCPTQPCGMQTVGCETDVGTIFGLVWVDGILQFAEIGAIPREPQ